MGVSVPAPQIPPAAPMLASTIATNNMQKALSSADDGPFGAAGTILTGPMGLGLSNTARSTTGGKTLLGA